MNWIQRARELCERATPGPWTWFHNHGLRQSHDPLYPDDDLSVDSTASNEKLRDYGRPLIEEDRRSECVTDAVRCSHDAEFMAESRTLLPEALESVERLVRALRRQRDWAAFVSQCALLVETDELLAEYEPYLGDEG